MSGLNGDIRIRVQKRCTLSGAVPVVPTRFHAGVATVPLVVCQTCPSSWPTQMIFGLPAATAIALMYDPAGCLIWLQLGPDVVVLGVLASSVRHSDCPPARMRSALFGSRMKGAMNSAFWVSASGILKGAGFHCQARVAWFQNRPQ